LVPVYEGAHLGLHGKNAFIEDSASQGSNSALRGLASIGRGATFKLHRGASVSTTGALVNDGNVELDTNAFDGGSSLTLAGALTNAGTLTMGNGSVSLSSSSKISATALTNTGSINLEGLRGSGANQALLDVTTGSAGFGTPGTLTGGVSLSYDSAIEFLSGQISTIAAGSDLFLWGNDAFIEDSTALGSNSALTGLASIGIGATLDLETGASVSTSGSVTNSGFLRLGVSGNPDSTMSIGGALTNTGTLDVGTVYYASGSSTLSIGGTLTNTGMLVIAGVPGNSANSVSAKSFVNSGTVRLEANATLNVSGATTNNGSILISGETEELAGAVGGTGSFSISGVNLQFDSSVSPGQTIAESGNGVTADALVLEQAQSFAATISGFGADDTIDAANFLFSGITPPSFVENSKGTGGTLTLHDGSLTADILMTGHYSTSNFTLAPDSGTGTLVKFV
jgi:hypothetical protein